MAKYHVPVIEHFEWQQSVKDRCTSPPGSYSEGDRFLIDGTGTGDWSGHDNEIAYYDSGWKFITPTEGFHLWVDDEDTVYIFNGTSWSQQSSGGGGDMYKSTYDTDDDGIVDNSEKLEGSTKAQVQDHTPKKHWHLRGYASVGDNTERTMTGDAWTWYWQNDLLANIGSVLAGDLIIAILTGNFKNSGGNRLDVKVDVYSGPGTVIIAGKSSCAGTSDAVRNTVSLIRCTDSGTVQLRMRWQHGGNTSYCSWRTIGYIRIGRNY